MASNIGSTPTPLVHTTTTTATDSAAQTTRARTPALTERDGGLGNISGKSSVRTGGGLGHKHTTWGKLGGGMSLGKCLASIIRLPGRGLRALGNAIQGERGNEGVRGTIGAAFKGLGNIVGTAAGLVGGTVTFAESVVSNLGGFALRLAGAAVLGGLSALATLVTGGQSKTTIEGMKIARDLVLDAPMLDRFTKSPDKLSAADAKAHLFDAEFAEGSMPHGSRQLDPDTLPASITRNWEVDDQTNMGGPVHLHAKGMLGTSTNVSLAFDSTGATPPDKGTLVVRFGGTNNVRHAITDAQQALGVPDGAYREARDLVAQLKTQYPNIRVIGHSMGGGLAQYAGISAGVKVTSFNGVGLHPHLRDKLGFDAIEKSNVTHINTSGDPLAKYAFLDMSSQQIGRHIEIPGGGHGMKHIQEQMRLAAR